MHRGACGKPVETLSPQLVCFPSRGLTVGAWPDGRSKPDVLLHQPRERDPPWRMPARRVSVGAEREEPASTACYLGFRLFEDWNRRER